MKILLIIQVAGTPLWPGNYCYGSRWHNYHKNFGFKQFVTALGIYAATDPL